MVYQKVANEEGLYKDKDNNRFDILACNYAERIENGEVVVNKGWDNFGSLEEAETAYGLTKVEGQDNGQN